MIPVEEAFSKILGTVEITKSVAVDIKDCIGRVIREDIKADRNMPPFNRVMMDGIAFSYNVWKKGKATFKVDGMQAAGSPMLEADASECVEIMTGAMLPNCYDTVVRYEDLEFSENGGQKHVTIATEDIIQHQNIHADGLDRKEGEVLIPKGTLIGPAEVGVIASVGEKIVQIANVPKTAVISTGDELVDVGEKPQDYQIRRSNVYSLHAALRKLGIKAESFHFKDDSEEIRNRIQNIIQEYDLIILSGGVSKGKFDFIPEVLKQSEVEQIFHKVEQRPGKPFWFGKSKSGTVIFGLPGNPVSTFLCYYKYVHPWIVSSMNGTLSENSAILAEDFEIDLPLTYFLQVKLKNEQGILKGFPIPGQGSGDFANLMDVDGFLEIKPEAGLIKKGTVLPLIQFR